MNLNKLINQFKVDCDFVSIRCVEQKNRLLTAKNGAYESASLNHTKGVMIEVLVDGQFAYAATDNLSTDSLTRCFKNARAIAKNASKYKIANLDVLDRGNTKGLYRSNTKYQMDSLSLSEIQARLIEASGHLKVSDKVINAKAYAQLSKTSSTLVSSTGMEIEQHFDQINFDLMATSQDANDVQSRSLGMMNAQGGLEHLDTNFLNTHAQRIGKESLELLEASECPTGEFDLLLAPDQLYLQIHESIGHPLEIDRIIGDERNYAGWSFVSASDFGNLKYGSDILNVTFDPTHEGELASYQFDDLGVKASKEYLIKDGVLMRGLGSIESQKRSGINGVASSRATSWNRAPIDRMANINIEPGKSSLKDMISATEKGIYMQTNRSWSIDDYRNKFQFGCEYAQLIENGKITKTLKNPNYHGISIPFWNALKMVGDQSSFEVWGSFYCGKGEPNQIIRVGHAMPTCLFENVSVFGGHQ